MLILFKKTASIIFHLIIGNFLCWPKSLLMNSDASHLQKNLIWMDVRPVNCTMISFKAVCDFDPLRISVHWQLSGIVKKFVFISIFFFFFCASFVYAFKSRLIRLSDVVFGVPDSIVGQDLIFCVFPDPSLPRLRQRFSADLWHEFAVDFLISSSLSDFCHQFSLQFSVFLTFDLHLEPSEIWLSELLPFNRTIISFDLSRVPFEQLTFKDTHLNFWPLEQRAWTTQDWTWLINFLCCCLFVKILFY